MEGGIGHGGAHGFDAAFFNGCADGRGAGEATERFVVIIALALHGMDGHGPVEPRDGAHVFQRQRGVGPVQKAGGQIIQLFEGLTPGAGVGFALGEAPARLVGEGGAFLVQRPGEGGKQRHVIGFAAE